MLQCPECNGNRRIVWIGPSNVRPIRDDACSLCDERGWIREEEFENWLDVQENESFYKCVGISVVISFMFGFLVPVFVAVAIEGPAGPLQENPFFILPMFTLTVWAAYKFGRVIGTFSSKATKEHLASEKWIRFNPPASASDAAD